MTNPSARIALLALAASNGRPFAAAAFLAPIVAELLSASAWPEQPHAALMAWCQQLGAEAAMATARRCEETRDECGGRA